MITIQIKIDTNYGQTKYPVVSKITFKDGVEIGKSLASYEEAESSVNMEEFYQVFKNYINNVLASKETFSEEILDKERDKEYFHLAQAINYFRNIMFAKWKEEA